MEWVTEVDCAYDASISIGTLTTTGDISIQLKDYAGNNLEEISRVTMYITSDAAGLTSAAIASCTASTGIVHEITATYAYEIITNASGLAVVELDGSGASTTYMHVVLPNGRVKPSEIIKWTV